MNIISQRWLLACATAEMAGMTAAASGAKVSQALVGEPVGGREVTAALAVVVIGGLIEGASLGTAVVGYCGSRIRGTVDRGFWL